MILLKKGEKKCLWYESLPPAFVDSEAKLLQIIQNENHIHRPKHVKVVSQDSKHISPLILINFLSVQNR